MADIAQLAIEVTSEGASQATDQLNKLTEASEKAETATGQLAEAASSKGREMGEALGGAAAGVETLGLSLSELAGPIGLAAGGLLTELVGHLIDMGDTATKAAVEEQKRHEQFMKNLQQETDALRDRAAKARDPFAQTSAQQQQLVEAQAKYADLQRRVAQAQKEIEAGPSSAFASEDPAAAIRAQEAILKDLEDQLGDAKQKVDDLVHAYGSLDSAARIADATQLAQAIHRQAEEYKLGATGILEQKVATAALTAEQRAQAEADLQVIQAHQTRTKAIREQIPLVDRLLAQLDLEVGAYGKITSATAEYQLAIGDLTPVQAKHLAALQATTESTLSVEAAQKSAAKQAIEDARQQSAAERELARAREEQARFLQQIQDAYAPASEAASRYYQTTLGLQELLDKGGISASEYALGISKARLEFVHLQAEGDSSLQSIIDLTDTAAQRMGQAFGQFATTGKLAFSDLVQSILADFAQLEAAKGFQEIAGYIEQFLGAPSISYPDLSVGIPTGGSGYIGMDTSLPTLAPAPGLPAGGGRAPAIDARMNVTIQNGPGGPQVGVESQGQQGQILAQKLRGSFIQLLVEEQRPGGVLNPKV